MLINRKLQKYDRDASADVVTIVGDSILMSLRGRYESDVILQIVATAAGIICCQLLLVPPV